MNIMAPYALTLLLALGILYPIQCDEVHDKVHKSVRDFAIDLLKVASKDGENIVFSPMSVSIMLTILQQGARGHTEEELAKILGCDAESTKVAYKNFIKKLLEIPPGVTIEWGNKVYSKLGLTILPDFKNNVEDNFGTIFEEIDFVGQSPEISAKHINSWISESTHGEIKDLILPHMVNSDAIMLLVNVMFFKGIWKNRFREKNTKLDVFEKSSSDSVLVSFMHQKNKFYTGRNTTLGVKWVELPFEGNTHKMIFVLPLKRHTLKKVMTRLTGQDLENMINYADVTEVRLKLPKFKLNGKYSLPNLLKNLGVMDVFTEASNLSGMSPNPFYVTDAFHEANVEIDEKGSTASAATVFTISRKLVLPETFRFDHPFLFFIVDNASKLPLFAGRVADPSIS